MNWKHEGRLLDSMDYLSCNNGHRDLEFHDTHQDVYLNGFLPDSIDEAGASWGCPRRECDARVTIHRRS